MALQEALQHIFNNDYQGTEAFINEVIIPVFGNDINRINLDYARDDEYHEKAEKAGIQNLIHVAQISDEGYNSNDISFFDVTLKDNVNVERARVNIQQLIRSIVARFSHILIVFHYKDVANRPWRFSYAYKQSTITSTTSAKRYTYVFGRDFRGRTAAERFEELKDSQHSDEDFEKAFSVQALSDEFFDRYRAYYAVFVEYITGEKYSDESKLANIIRRWDWKTSDSSNQFETTFERDAKATRDYIKKMFGRIVFLYFLQRKGWLYDNDGRSDAQYMKHLFDNADALQASFLDDVLEILFFYVLNTKPEDRISEARKVHKDVTILPGWDKIPFLNGGLFEQDDIDPKKCTFPAEYFREFFNFLNSYNFTIDENDQEDAEIGIDPEMLGRIFENLLEDNKDKGAFYTPKEIVDYMCRESIIAYLLNDVPEDTHNLIRNFVETLDASQLNAELKYSLRKKLQAVKICDPAIGSGAFPMGLVNLLSKLYVAMKSDTDTAKMKRHIMEQNIYGVDIEQGAVDIARLRFWLAMIVEEKEPIPLPNLHFKIMQGNSLLECYDGVDLSDLAKYIQQVDKRGQLLLDYTDNTDRIELNSLLKQYYSTSKHDVRDSIFKSIIDNVREQLMDKGVSFPESKDPSANMDFFLWHTWFSDVFENGGFDIVIGNPPYISYYSNTGSQLSDEMRQLFVKNYDSVKKENDRINSMNLMLERGLKLLKTKGVLSYIINKTLSVLPSYVYTRDYILNNYKIDYIVNDISPFEAVVDNIIIGLSKSKTCSEYDIRLVDSNLSCFSYESISNLRNNRLKEFIISKNKNIINKIDKFSSTLQNILFINRGVNIGGCFDSFLSDTKLDETYRKYLPGTANIKPYLYFWSEGDGWMKLDTNLEKELKRKGKTLALGDPERYNMERIFIPESSQSLMAAYCDAPFYSAYGLMVGTSPNDSRLLKYACLLLNSKLFTFYAIDKEILRKGNKATPHVGVKGLRSIPIPLLTSENLGKIENKVNKIIEMKKSLQDCSDLELELDIIVYKLYNLTYDEVLIIDPETPISCEQYENFKF